ncbi:hypothetical protein PVNG_05530 [Plasmodium vivax North Korean]|uniref:Variable surface protein Vir7-like protein n=1 Tax=Plasmodium vivax North Korean TaxID=1035514 RepID=A0A0J9U2E4_PLAVI|nr:hypothetical protein PVNG_05530 [Plasmodium vivax North Korean]
MNSYFKNKGIAKSVCEDIVKLYKSLNNLKANSECSKDYKSDCGFFNYWVNFKIRKNTINESDSIKTIYNGIESQFMGVNGYDMNINFLWDINKNDLHKMNILYRLYKKYSDIDGILENSTNETKKLLLSYSTACCTDYLEANYICNGGNDDDSNNHSQFCTHLKEFKTTYEKLYDRVNDKGDEYSNNFIKLSECKNNNIMTTTLVGTTVGLVPLLVGLYKVK